MKSKNQVYTVYHRPTSSSNAKMGQRPEDGWTIYKECIMEASEN
jgi:hypothetical protein